MAGIGFKLRKMAEKNGILGVAGAYSYSAMLSAGPWVISILAILAVGFIQISSGAAIGDVVRFQIIVTYAFVLAATLILSGFLQLPFTRFIADLIYARREDEVLGNLFGVLFFIWVAGILLYGVLTWVLLPQTPLTVKVLVVSIFVLLSAVWVSNTVVNSLQYFNRIVLAYSIAYLLIVLGAYFVGSSLTRLLYLFLLGNALLLTVMMILVAIRYNSDRLLRFDFFKAGNFYLSLGLAGLFYNLGTWIDKIIFWYHPLTGEAIFGRIHHSIVYDVPVFLAYLSIVPGMAIFFYRLETDFAEVYARYTEDIANRGTLSVIRGERNDMATIIRLSLVEILLLQAIVDLFIYHYSDVIFHWLHIPQLYLSLFFVLTVGAMLQLLFMSILAVLFYLDRRVEAMWLTLLFFLLNAGLTWLSIILGPSFYGYGYAVSLLISFAASVAVLNYVMKRLVYETYMLR